MFPVYVVRICAHFLGSLYCDNHQDIPRRRSMWAATLAIKEL